MSTPDDVRAETRASRAEAAAFRSEISAYRTEVIAWHETTEARFDRLDNEIARLAEIVFDILRRLDGDGST